MMTAVDSLCLYTKDWEASAERFRVEVGGPSEKREITNFTALRQATRDFCNVKLLYFSTHGRGCGMQLDDGSIVEDFRMIVAPSTFLWKNARILFDGCAIGEGPKGDEFLDSAGEHLLRGHGGIVGASTVDTFCWTIGPWSSETYMEFQRGALVKIRRYDISGHRTGWLERDRYGRAA